VIVGKQLDIPSGNERRFGGSAGFLIVLIYYEEEKPGDLPATARRRRFSAVEYRSL
jgi:hypothetical protein